MAFFGYVCFGVYFFADVYDMQLCFSLVLSSNRRFSSEELQLYKGTECAWCTV